MVACQQCCGSVRSRSRNLKADSAPNPALNCYPIQYLTSLLLNQDATLQEEQEPTILYVNSLVLGCSGGHLAELSPPLRGGGGLRVPGVRGGGHRALPLQGRGLRDRLQVASPLRMRSNYKLRFRSTEPRFFSIKWRKKKNIPRLKALQGNNFSNYPRHVLQDWGGSARAWSAPLPAGLHHRVLLQQGGPGGAGHRGRLSAGLSAHSQGGPLPLQDGEFDSI